MKTKLPSLFKATSVAFALAIAAAGNLSAAVPDLLEQGIFAEETKGDIDGAIDFYRKAVAENKTNGSAAAQAQFRLGQCYLKKNRTADALAAFQKLVDDFPNEKELVAKAKEFLPGRLTLLPVPWMNGERMQLAIKLATGLDVGVSVYHADLVPEGGGAWRVGVRSAGIGEALSTVEVDRENFRPRNSHWKHSLFGDVNAVYGADSVSLQKGGVEEKKTVPLAGTVYDNEEVVHLMRRLPLAPGYKATIPIFVTLTGMTIPMGLEVSGPEAVQVKAGNYECFKVTLSIRQTFWYSTDPSRLLVKFEAGGAIAELESVGQYHAGEPGHYEDAELGVKLTAPADWRFHRHSDGSSKAEVLDLLDPEAGAILALRLAPTNSLSAAEKASPRALAEARIAEMTRGLKDAQVDPAGWRSLTVSGHPAIGFAVNFKENEKPMTAYDVVSIGTANSEQFSLETAPDKLAQYRAIFDAIVAGYRSTR